MSDSSTERRRDPRFYLYMPAQLCPSIFFTGFFFHQIHLVETKGWELAHWGPMFAIYAVLAWLPKTRLVGIGLLIHLFLDGIDCVWMSFD